VRLFCYAAFKSPDVESAGLVNPFRVCETYVFKLYSRVVSVGAFDVSVVNKQRYFDSAKDFSRGNPAFSRLTLRVTLLAWACLLVAAPADAAIFWSDSDPAVMSAPVATAQPRRQKRPRRIGAKPMAQVKETAKPQGPLVIAISIERQTLRVYDANGLFAETPVSTGMRGHSTPMGVFSVIQKDKFHRSNIYSGAPMPYMQRITWSGVAIHAGVLPGYPASHGCIRMPMAFAVKMWGWTRMGARVVIAPGELSPSEFSHPLLAARKPAEMPVAAADPARPADTAGRPTADAKPPMSSASLELKGTADEPTAMTAAEATATAKRDQTQTADATGSMALPAGGAIVSDAAPEAAGTPSTETARAAADAGAFDRKAAEFRAATENLLDGGKDAAGTVPGVMVEQPAAAMKAADIKNEKTAAPKTANADAAKDEARQPDGGPTSALKTEVAPQPKRSGQIAVLVSRKDSKLYVRQNFAPLFDVPVAITAGDRPLGTHVFTARADKDNAGTFHWSVVSMPAVARHIEDNGATRRRKNTGAINMITPTPAPDTAAEALDRIKIPDDAMIKISEALSNGGSIIVSDLGIAGGGETGLGTDFIVPLR
jgi:lipoprotein-anchoring transpeptidase ErfK/SrfK